MSENDLPFSQRFAEASRRLLAESADPAAAERLIAGDFAHVVASGSQPRRFFHDVPHFESVASAGDAWEELEGLGIPRLQTVLAERGLSDYGQPVLDVIVRAGAHHDTVYTQVDAGLLPDTKKALSPFVEFGESPIRLRSSPHATGDQKRLFEMALTVFGFHEGQTLDPYGGQNEFLSALDAALEGQKAGLRPKYILAEMAMIEATIPFRAADRFMRLENRLRKANRLLSHGERLDEAAADNADDEVSAILYGAVQLANRDVLGFRKPYDIFERDGQELLKETDPAFATPAGLYAACLKRADFLSRISAIEDASETPLIFHSYRHFPPPDIRDRWDDIARENCRQECAEMRHYAAAIRVLDGLPGADHSAARDFSTLCQTAPEDGESVFPRAVVKIAEALSGDEVALLTPQGTTELPPASVSEAYLKRLSPLVLDTAAEWRAAPHYRGGSAGHGTGSAASQLLR